MDLLKPSVYHEFKDFHGGAITTLARRWDDSEANFVYYEPLTDTNSEEILETIWTTFGTKDGIMLSKITHLSDTPWAKCVRKVGGEDNLKTRTIEIDDIDMLEYFKSVQWKNVKELMTRKAE